MDEAGFLEPFQSVGITPPRGRHGHSVPTPRPLQGSKLVMVAGRAEDRGEVSHGIREEGKRGEYGCSLAVAPPLSYRWQPCIYTIHTNSK